MGAALTVVGRRDAIADGTAKTLKQVAFVARGRPAMRNKPRKRTTKNNGEHRKNLFLVVGRPRRQETTPGAVKNISGTHDSKNGAAARAHTAPKARGRVKKYFRNIWCLKNGAGGAGRAAARARRRVKRNFRNTWLQKWSGRRVVRRPSRLPQAAMELSAIFVDKQTIGWNSAAHPLPKAHRSLVRWGEISVDGRHEPAGQTPLRIEPCAHCDAWEPH